MSTGRLGAGDTAIQPTIFDAKADILTATAADTPARLAVGSNDQVLTADSTTATGLKWSTITSGLPNATAYTPTLTNVTLGNGTLTTYYISTGDTVFYYGYLKLGSTTSVTGPVQFDLPFNVSTAIGSGAFYGAGVGYFYDASTGQTYYTMPAINNLDSLRFGLLGAASTYLNSFVSVDGSTPVTLATNDECNFFIWYRKA